MPKSALISLIASSPCSDGLAFVPLNRDVNEMQAGYCVAKTRQALTLEDIHDSNTSGAGLTKCTEHLKA